jgi:hypothetical protein
LTPPSIRCEQKANLLAEYVAAAANYGRVAQLLISRDLGDEEYRRIRSTTELARMRAEDARKRLDSHTAEHGC